MAQPKLGYVFDRKIQIAPQHSRKRQTDKADFQSPWLVAVLSASRLTQHSPYIPVIHHVANVRTWFLHVTPKCEHLRSGALE